MIVKTIGFNNDHRTEFVYTIFVLNRKGASPPLPTNIIYFLYVSFDARADGAHYTAAIILYDIIIEQCDVIVYRFLISYCGLTLNLFDYCFTPRIRESTIGYCNTV